MRGVFGPEVVHGLRRATRALLGMQRPVASGPSNESVYETLYERLATQIAGDEVVGDGPFDLVGRRELSVLVMEGLTPTDTLLDFGCGTGRLALHAIPALASGHYIGTDISKSILARAEHHIALAFPNPSCRISWFHQRTEQFPVPDASVDMMCAFSVFTHMEHEDSFRYLEDAIRVLRPGGRLVLSCLSLDFPLAREVFLAQADADFRTRWKQVRNVTTSRDLISAVANLAGWTSLRWYPGDERNVRPVDGGEAVAFGQSILVLQNDSKN